MAGQVKPIPVPVILAAVNGDENALAAVVAHYQKYIRALATRPVKDEYGNEYLYVDEDMRLRLETKLIHSIEIADQGGEGKRIHQSGPLPGRRHLRRHDGPPRFQRHDGAACRRQGRRRVCEGSVPAGSQLH